MHRTGAPCRSHWSFPEIFPGTANTSKRNIHRGVQGISLGLPTPLRAALEAAFLWQGRRAGLHASDLPREPGLCLLHLLRCLFFRINCYLH